MRYVSIFALASVVSIPLYARADDAAVERGAKAVRSALNPAAASLNAWENIWKTWGLKEKPADFEQLVQERYGLVRAPYENDGLPMGLALVNGKKGVDGTCLMCHAGSVAGQTVIGLGNASIEFKGFFDDLMAGQLFAPPWPFQLSRVRGTIEATAVVNFLLEFRNPDLSLRVPKNMKVADDLCEDVPAWWLLKHKRTMYHTGGGHARSVRTMMAFLLNPLNSADYIKSQEGTFTDIQSYLLSLQAPKYPFSVDSTLADRGHKLFVANCAKCHGTYGENRSYPNKVIPLEQIGTDPRLVHGTTLAQAEHFLKSWFADERWPDKKSYPMQTVHGYQAPPLDGVWATAPYFHNGAAPTVYHVLNSKARPKVFTRSYRTEREDYDIEKMGWKIQVLDQPGDMKMSGLERRKFYDTTQPGRSNAGHTFGDQLTDDERRAVIEYLKTL